MKIQFLKALFALTGSRSISERIGELRACARYEARKASHIAAGGVVATYRSADSVTELFL